jgi:hypothetical protein
MTTMDYKLIFDERFKEEVETSGCPPHNKLAFIGSVVFDFTTYDGDMDEFLAIKMIEVVECILSGTTFEYQKDEANYMNYMTMVNMPFLKDKIEWGASIRGAWFDEYGHHYEKEPRVYKIGIVNDLIVSKIEIKDFMKQLIEWSKS